MAATPPPSYTPPPADLPQRGDRATFSNRVDAWVTWFSTVILTQLAAMIANAYANALDAAASATAALGYRDTASAAATAAQAARDLAEDYRDQAAISAASAAGTQVTATSTTSIAIGAGDKTFTTQAGKQFALNVPIIAVSASDASKTIQGTVLSYSGTTLVMTNVTTTGSGTVADWNISISGIRGPAGGVSGGNLTGALNELKGSDVASAATTNVWVNGGNLVPLTGAAVITSLGTAPQPGARRRLLAVGTPTFTNGANLVVKGGTYTAVAGDEFDVVAETATKILLTVHPLGDQLVSQRMVLTDLKSASTNAASSVAGVQTRDLNTIAYNTIPGATLAANAALLPPGTYVFRGRAPAASVGRHQAKLYNATASTTAIVGANALSALPDTAMTDSVFTGVISVAVTTSFRIDHYTFAVGSLGSSSGSGEPSIYSTLEIERIA